MDRYAIPSYGRPEGLRAKTGAFLLRAGVSPGEVDVYVAGASQADLYRDVISDLGFNLCLTTKGIREARNTIHSSYRHGTRLTVLDDDLGGVVRKFTDKKLVEVTDFPALCAKAFRETRARKARMWGVYPTPNALFMNHRTETGLRLCVGALYGIVVTSPAFRLECETKEDYELSLLHYGRDGLVVRLDNVAAKAKIYDGEGGCQEGGMSARQEMDYRSIALLMQRFPDLVSHKKSKSPYPQIRLARKGPR